MKSTENRLPLENFRWRKIVHYTLIACILLIQILIAGFFYNEFVNKKQLSFIEKQLEEIHSVENVTDAARKDLFNAQENFQRYLTTEDDQYLQSYFQSVKLLTKNLDSINKFNKNPRLQNILKFQKKNSVVGIENLKSMIDSTTQYTTKSNYKKANVIPKLKKFNFDYNFDKYDVQTKTYSEPVVKKGIFGRLGDAISGKENIKKDSTVVTLKEGKSNQFSKMKNEIDSIFNSVNNYYLEEVKRIEVTITKNNNKNTDTDKNNIEKVNTIYSNLLVYSNDLMKIYEDAVQESKSNLEKEFTAQNSASNKIRNQLVLGLMILMFIVSILIMYLTRIGFVYEQKLTAANEQIKENVNFKNRILGMLSHELRSPLKIIGIFIKRINKKTTDETVKEYLKSISFTNDTLLMQANQILEYTKNQQVENKLIPVVFNLKEEITSILNAIEPYIETRNNKFIIHENINSKMIVYSDNTKINQIFMNILGNANKFTENGEITVSTSTEAIDDETISLKTTISDTGVGISESDLKQIFEPYYQGIISDQVENLGAGLGLSLCKEIVELYHGKISVSSELKKGTTVNFNINLKLNESPRI
jgi:signal transduction histidine kinase